MAFKKYKEEAKGMRYPAINDLIGKADNKYELVLATAKRARELIDGDEALVNIVIDNQVSIATSEIATDMVHITNQAPEKQPEEETITFPDTDMENAFSTEALAESL